MLTLILATPVALAAVALLVGVVVLVWVGRWQGWFGRDAAWTVVVWPLPLVSLIAPLLAAAAWFVARSLGLAGAEGSLTAGLLYLGAYAVPWVVLTLAAPRWLFPAWARARVAEPPSQVGTAPVRGAVPAVYCPRGRGHGSLGRWVWRIDGVAGHVVVDDEVLRFRPVRDTPDDAAAIRDLDDELDAEAVAQLGLEFGPDLHLQAPRGGWWTRRRVDVELSAVTDCVWHATRRSAGDGLLGLEVVERGVVHLWVTDVARVRAWLAGTVGAPGRSLRSGTRHATSHDPDA